MADQKNSQSPFKSVSNQYKMFQENLSPKPMEPDLSESDGVIS